MNKQIPIMVLFLAIGAGLGYFIGKKTSPAEVSAPAAASASTEEVATHEIRTGGYEFINPLVECECFKPSKQIRIVLLEQSLRMYIAGAISAGKVKNVSVYFRDLNNGPWIGIGENEVFTPASLLKVPVMIATLKKAEEESLFLKKRITVMASLANEFQQNIKDTGLVVPGKSYTVEDLVQRMIQRSDNHAAATLWNELGLPFIDQVFEDIQVKVSGVRSPADDITVKEYSTFFRILYNASYLNREMSELALRILSKSKFTSGLVAGLPPNVTIAHKFGERGIPGTDGLQLHDCGIVYAPQLPYLICVMTRGKDFNELSSVIADISAKVYQNVSGK